MKLWNDGKAGSAGSAIRATVKGQVAKINRQVVARGVRAVNAMRNAELEEKYAGYLENGTKKMAARPFVDKIKEKATPEIEKIYKEPYG